MFSTGAAAGHNARVGLHSFKAGKLNRVEGTKRVKPDPRKGLIYLEEVDELLHFYWKDRNGAVEDDLIIFPDEAEFIKVQESPSGRVYALKFSSSSQIMFYWMQEKETVNDESDVKRVNDLIADPKAVAPQAAVNQRAGLAGLAGLGAQGTGGPLGGIDLSAAAQTMGLSQDQLMQILGSEDLSQIIGPGARNLFGTSASGNGDSDAARDLFSGGDSEAVAEQMALDPPGPENPSGEASASAAQQAAIPHLNDRHESAPGASTPSLREILAGIRVPSQAEQQESIDTEQQLSLEDVLTPDQILPLLADVHVREQLFPHLPNSLLSDPPTESEVREIMTSVQWKQALSGLSYALNNGGEAVLRSLDIDAGAAATTTTTSGQGASGVEAFLRAVARAVQREVEDSAGGRDEDRMEE